MDWSKENGAYIYIYIKCVLERSPCGRGCAMLRLMVVSVLFCLEMGPSTLFVLQYKVDICDMRC
jgi:hypothetical protein